MAPRKGKIQAPADHHVPMAALERRGRAIFVDLALSTYSHQIMMLMKIINT